MSQAWSGAFMFYNHQKKTNLFTRYTEAKEVFFDEAVSHDTVDQSQKEGLGYYHRRRFEKTRNNCTN